MKLRKKALLLVGTVYFVLLLVIDLASSHFILDEYARVERDFVLPNATRMLEAYASELTQMDTATADWALWDDVYDFVVDGNDAFIRDNLTDFSIETLRLNAMMYVQSSGHVTFATGFDLKTGQKTTLPEGLIPSLRPGSPLMSLTGVDSSLTGVLMLPGGPLLVSARPICNTARDAPIRGVMIMGRFLDELVLGTIRRVVSRPVTMARVDGDLPPDFKEARVSLEAGESAFLRVGGPDTISVYALIRDIYGAPALLLRADSSRDIYQSGVQSMIILLGWLTLAGLMFGGATLWLLEKSILSRLRGLAASVRSFHPDTEELPHVPVRGADELSDVCTSINSMLAALGTARSEQLKSQEALTESEARLRTIIEHSPSVYFSHTPDHVITYVSPRIEEILGFGPEEMKRRWMELVTDNPVNAEGYALTQRAIDTGQAQRPYELEVRGAGGNKIWVEIRETPVVKNGKTVAVVGTLTDITEQKKFSQSLRESEQRYQILFDEMMTGYALHEIILDPDGVPCDYRFLEINPAFEKITGLTRESTLGKTVRELLPQNNNIWIERYGRVALTGVAAHFENHAEALGRDFEVVAYCPKRGQFVALFVDVTDRLKAEKNLKLFRALVDQSKDSFEIIDPETGRFIDVNERACQDLGYSREELLALTVFDIDPSLDVHRFANSTEALRKADTLPWNGVHRRKDGSTFPVEVNLKYVRLDRDYLVSVVRDTTEQLRTMEAQARLATAVEQAAETIVITDASGHILYANPAFEQVTGYSRAEAEGQNPRILKSGKHEKDFYRQMWERLIAGKVWSGRLTNKRKDGTLYEEDATISPVLDATGKIINFVAVKRDVTREVALEVQLHQTQKLEAVGRLAGGVAHDFNNQLQVIIGHAEIALATRAPDDPYGLNVQEILKAAQHSAGLTRQLLAFSRQQAIVPVVLDLNESIAGSLKMLKRLIGENIQLNFVMRQNPWNVFMDPVQLDQLLVNLVVNARDAIVGSGTITIEITNETLHEADCRDKVDFVMPGDYVGMVIQDDGQGMSDDVLAHIFEPFFTTKDVGKGTGLGLATVYGIIKQNGGAITAKSAPGQGATFTLYLPRSKHAPGVTTKNTAAQIPAGTETLLIVEDEESVLNLVQRKLSQLGYTVLVASSPAIALQRCKQYTEPIHLLLTDVIMPEMSGKLLAERVQKLRPGIRILYMSGYPADIMEQQGLLPAEVHVLPKPFTVVDLTNHVRAVLDKAPRN